MEDSPGHHPHLGPFLQGPVPREFLVSLKVRDDERLLLEVKYEYKEGMK